MTKENNTAFDLHSCHNIRTRRHYCQGCHQGLLGRWWLLSDLREIRYLLCVMIERFVLGLGLGLSGALVVDSVGNSSV